MSAALHSPHGGALSALHKPSYTNPGPLARLQAVMADPNTMEIIAQRVADGEKLRVICKDWEIPYGRTLTWIASDKARNDLYWNAVAFAAHAAAEDAVQIADDAEPASVPHAKLRIDARRWQAERLFKDRYAARTEQTGAGGVPLEITDPLEQARRVAFLMEMNRRANEKVIEHEPAQAPEKLPALAQDEMVI